MDIIGPIAFKMTRQVRYMVGRFVIEMGGGII